MTYISNPSSNFFSRSDRIEEVDPLDQRFLCETLLEATDLATNTTAEVYVSMNGYRYLGITGIMAITTDSVTVTVHATCEDDVDPTGLTYVDVTEDWFGSASWEDTNFCVTTSIPIAVTWVKIQYVTSNDSGDDADLNLYAKKMF